MRIFLKWPFAPSAQRCLKTSSLQFKVQTPSFETPSPCCEVAPPALALCSTEVCDLLYAQLLHHKPRSDEHLSALKAWLSDVAHAYSGSPIDWGDFLMTKECFQAIKALQSNDDIYITKPDKDFGVVILNENDYIRKMGMILTIPPNSSTLDQSTAVTTLPKLSRAYNDGCYD